MFNTHLYRQIDSYLGFSLWMSKVFRDDVPFVVLNSEGYKVGETYGTLHEFVEDLMHE